MADQIIQVLDDLARRFGVAVDWGAETVLPYLNDIMNRIVAYSAARDALWILLCAGGFYVLWRLWCLVQKENKEAKENLGKREALYYTNFTTEFLIVITALILTAVVIGCVVHLVKCVALPEVVTFDYIRSKLSLEI